jgi:hypothetical protein
MSSETGDQGDIELGEGKAPALEPCVAEDIDKIARVGKDALRIFASKKFGYSLDCGGHIKHLRADLTKRIQIALNMIIDKPGATDEEKAAIEKVIPRYLLHPTNKRVFGATPELLTRPDMIPCTKDGKPLEMPEEEIEDEDEE